MRAAGLRYYLASLPTLWAGVRRWPAVLAALLARRPFELALSTGLRFKVRGPMDMWIIKETCLDRDYERAGVPLQPDWTVVDIGAGLGDFTVYAARRCRAGQVFAFEPFPESFALLQENVRLNGLTNVQAAPRAVSGAAGVLTLVAAGAAVQHHTVGQEAGAAPRLEVAAVTLEQALAELPRGRCDFLKVDCEGAEYEILMQASPAALRNIARLCLEYHDGVTAYAHTDLADHLRARGFTVRLTPNPVHADLGFLYAENIAA